MPIIFECPTCRKQYTFKKDVGGRKAKCICGEIFIIPPKTNLEDAPAKNIKHSEDGHSNVCSVKSDSNQNEKFVVAGIAAVILVIGALSLFVVNKRKLQLDKGSLDSFETTRKSTSLNPKMRDLHDVLVPAGYIVDEYGGNMAWVKDDDAFYFEVHGGGTGQIDKEIKVLKRFKNGTEMWSTEKVKVEKQNIYISKDDQWLAVFKSRNQVSPKAKAGIEIDSHDGEKNTSYRRGRVNYSLVDTIRKSWQEEGFRNKSRAEQAKALATIVLLVQTDCPDSDDCNATLDYIQNSIDNW